MHAAVDKMEDPICMTEQGIREMREDLEKAMESLAQIKALAIRTKNDKNRKTSEAEDYEKKAVLLLSKAQKGDLEMSQAERLAKEALVLKENLMAEANALQDQQAVHEKSADEIQKNVDVLKFNIPNGKMS